MSTKAPPPTPTTPSTSLPEGLTRTCSASRRRAGSRVSHDYDEGDTRPYQDSFFQQVTCDDGALSSDNKSELDYTSDEDLRDDPDDGLMEQPDETEKLLELLSSIAEEQAQKEGYVHRSITCNHCGVSPIRGFRFKCANCVDYDVCEACEALDVHLKTHVFVKIRIPIPPLMNARSALFPVIYPGEDFTNEVVEYDAVELQKKSHFDVVELDAFHEQFLSLSNIEEGGIDRETFEHCLGPLGVEKNLIVERIFKFFDRNSDDIIDFEELVMGLSVLCKGGLDERMKWAFKGYDLNEDGFISRDELHRMFKAYFHLSMELVRDVVKTMEEGMMESFDDEAAKPVSAAFAGPSGPYTGDVGASSSDEGEDDDADLANPSRSKRILKHAKRATEDGYDILSNFASGGGSSAGPCGIPTRPRRGSSAETSPSYAAMTQSQVPNLLISPQSSHNQPPSSSLSSHNTSTTRPIRRLNLRRSLPHLSTSSPLRMSLNPSSPQAFGLPSPTPASAIEEQWPIMEAMSQDAIEEMVDKVFEMAGKSESNRQYHQHQRLEQDDGLTYEDFAAVVELDSNLLAWFEALGSVF
ncbi:hypothetical protein PhCBS80983_g06116 [Powellomyces hirtus]|uniref:Calmodulin n=1 Tax=Powellomyces hirtus TaxID=109895 RepID=A0A507DR04_9FUNG|nr:hypothetical protein PhCBS80983_g06116 [Powellomyces hirtus]